MFHMTISPHSGFKCACSNLCHYQTTKHKKTNTHECTHTHPPIQTHHTKVDDQTCKNVCTSTQTQPAHAFMRASTHTHRHTNYSPQELSAHRPHLQDACGQPLPLAHGWWLCQLLLLDQAACHAGGHCTLLGRDDHADARVAATAQGPTPGIHHEADEETAKDND